jgi:glucan phosphoethanolaminetransferase (alkaline phosphatase superfamily)
MASYKSYAYFFALLAIFWPLFLLFGHWELWKIGVLIVLSGALFALVADYSSSKDVTFINGLAVISATMRSGCADVTIIYMMPFFLFIYALFFVHTVIGLIRGREYTQAQWRKFTDKYFLILQKRMKPKQ